MSQDAPTDPLDPRLVASQDALLPGAELVRRLWVDKDAALNWARLSGRVPVMPEARLELMDAIVAGGLLSATPPAWMTSPRPGVDAWLEVEGVFLSLVLAPTSGRTWVARNATAPRRGRRVPAAAPEVARPPLSAELLARLPHVPPLELAGMLVLSAHALDRLAERAGVEDPQDVERVLARSARLASQTPAWADPSGRQSPTVLCDLGDDLLALVVREDVTQPGRLVVTTAISRAWARRDLPQSGPELAATLRVSDRVCGLYAQAQGLEASVDARAVLLRRVAAAGLASFGDEHRRGAQVIVDDLRLTLRHLTDQQQTDDGARWSVSEVAPAT